MKSSLWGDEFKIEETPKKVKKIKEKISKSKNSSATKTFSSRKLSKWDKIETIKAEVDRVLGSYRNNTLVITDRKVLTCYINNAIANDIIAIDTETNNSLDPLTCKIMGLCIYTPNEKNVYIPINHVDINTEERLEYQLTEEDIAEELKRLKDTKILMHNGKFDYQVIKCTTGVELEVYWDTMIAAKLLNENEPAGLKSQYIDKIDPSIEHYSIDGLFEKIEYAIINPETFALYAATDAYMTYKLYEYQQEKFADKANSKILELFKTVEMPIMKVAAKMELTGICIDTDYAKRLSDKYHKLYSEVQSEIDAQLSYYAPQIIDWRNSPEANLHLVKDKNHTSTKNGKYVLTLEEIDFKEYDRDTIKLAKSKNEQLENPVNLTSPTQLAILIYDILKHPPVDKDKPRGTGEDILKKIDLPICELVLKQRGLLKLINTYIDKIPQCINPKDNRLHAHFNQLGAATGRFSSSDPNLQNIPSKDKSIRMLFTAQPGYVLVGSDYSQQEPRLLSNYAKDDNMINAYKEGKDLYATIASGVYKNDYWDNMEFYQDGTPNPAGKKRRSSCKSLLLGMMYGRGIASIAEQIGGDVKEAQKIVNDFYNSFPKVKNWIDKTHESVKQTGYVEDLWGRRRRLPDIQLPEFEIKLKDNKSTNFTFNPLLFCKGLFSNKKDPRIEKYSKLNYSDKSRKELEIIKKGALTEGVIIKDNRGFISQAERQSVNARVQGGAATMSKKAMILVDKDPILNELGFRLLLAVHDELIGECPIEVKDKVAERLCEVMKSAALPECIVPFKCDPTIETSWYYTDYSDMIKEEYKKLIDSTSKEESLDTLFKNHIECTQEQLLTIISS